MLLKSFQRKGKVEIIVHTLVSILFLLVAVSYIYILVWALLAGLKTHTEIVISPFSLPTQWNWQHFIDVFTLLEVNGNNFMNMLFNSIWFSVVGSFLQQLITINFAYCCNKYRFPGSWLPYSIILVMLVLPIYGNAGAMYNLFKTFGLIDSYAHVLVSLSGFSIFFLFYSAFFKNLSWTYAEAAMIDGAGDFAIYFRVMFPQAKALFGALFLTSWIGSWNSFESPLIYLPKLPTLPVGIYQFNIEMIYRARMDILFAACVIVSIPALILFVAFNKVITTNISIGGIK